MKSREASADSKAIELLNKAEKEESSHTPMLLLLLLFRFSTGDCEVLQFIWEVPSLEVALNAAGTLQHSCS